MKKLLFITELLFVVSLSLSAQVPTSGLAGYWPFRGNANDESTNANNGSVIGATLVADRFNNANSAYLFDGNDYITVPHHTSLDMSGPVSFSVWVKPSVIQTSGNRMILGKSDYSTKTNYLIRQIPNGYLQWEYQGYTENVINPMVVSTWHHIVVTAEGPTLEKKIYLDNQLVATQLASGASFGQVTNPLTFGYAGYNSEFYEGSIDDIRIYNTVLSVSDVNALFNEENGTPTTIQGTFENIITSYPNPTTGEIHIDLGESYSDIHLVISDVNGMIIRQKNYSTKRFLEVVLNENPGVYFLTIQSDSRKVTLRIIKN
jgi:hypothetical protein